MLCEVARFGARLHPCSVRFPGSGGVDMQASGQEVALETHATPFARMALYLLGDCAVCTLEAARHLGFERLPTILRSSDSS